jgi:hypothetical protein
MPIEYLTFGRDSEFLVQSMVLSSLFVLAGEIWMIPSVLVANASGSKLFGLTTAGVIVSLVVGGVVVLSGQQTYSPRFNRLRNCAVATVLHVLLGTSVVGTTGVLLSGLFSLTLSWSLSTLIAGVFLLGTIYSLAVTAWHYQRVLSVEYDASEFEAAAETFLDALRGVNMEGEIKEEKIQNIVDAVEQLSSSTIHPRLEDERSLNDAISTLACEFNNNGSLEQELIVRGKQRNGSVIDDDLRTLHETLVSLRDDLKVIT